MKRRRFLYVAGSGLIAAKTPSIRQRTEEEIPDIQLDFSEMKLSHSEELNIQPRNELGLFDDLIWEKPENFDGEGDCDDFASYINAALEEKGYKTVCVSGTLRINTEKEDLEGLHMWTEAEIDGEYYLFDINFPYSFVERDDTTEIKEAARGPEILDIEYKPALMFSSRQTLTSYRSEFAESSGLSGLF